MSKWNEVKAARFLTKQGHKVDTDAKVFKRNRQPGLKSLGAFDYLKNHLKYVEAK